MFFNSFTYLCFFVAVFVAYWVGLGRFRRAQNAFLLMASYVFYGMWDWRFLILIMLSSVVDFYVGQQLHRSDQTSRRKALLGISLAVNLGLLFVFKYYGFFAGELMAFLQGIGIKANLHTLKIILPVGISFYTFQTLSYTIDIYKRKFEPTDSVIDFFAYVAFFPQLVAGPIERAAHLLPQFHQPRVFQSPQAVLGCKLILWGLFKKVVVADNCSVVVDQIFGAEQYTALHPCWLLVGAAFFAFQIYSDFSGYSDMAIGSAKLLGFDLMTNFRTPYFARDIPEFWRRWHISLTTWFRDYVYIPLGGSHGGKVISIRNVIVVFLVSGIWHGANWTFIAWGLFSALCFLPSFVFEKHRTQRGTVAEGAWLPSPMDVFRMARTFLVVCVGWVFFRAESIADAFAYFSAFGSGLTAAAWSPAAVLQAVAVEFKHAVLYSLIGIAVLLIVEWLGREKPQVVELPLGKVSAFIFFQLIFWLILLLGQFDHKEFIYFQF